MNADYQDFKHKELTEKMIGICYSVLFEKLTICENLRRSASYTVLTGITCQGWSID